MCLLSQYGKVLYDNYNRAVQKTGLASRLAKLGNTEATAIVGSSKGTNLHHHLSETVLGCIYYTVIYIQISYMLAQFLLQFIIN